MSMYTKIPAADIPAAFAAALSVTEVVTAQRTRMSVDGLTNVVFGKGHPPRGIPL